MKKVRFESPVKGRFFSDMEDRECHSPRPFTERQICTKAPDIYNNCAPVVTYSSDPVRMFECSNSSPYPLMNKTDVKAQVERSQWSPSNELELSMLDAIDHEPRKPAFGRPILKPSGFDKVNNDANRLGNIVYNKQQTISPSTTNMPPNVLLKDDFFLKRNNISRTHFDLNPVQQQFKKICLDKENNPFATKAQIIQMSALNQPQTEFTKKCEAQTPVNRECMCHHCVKNISFDHNTNARQTSYQQYKNCNTHYTAQNSPQHIYCMCGHPPPPKQCSCCEHSPQFKTPDTIQSPISDMNAVEKKTWAIEKYEQLKNSDSKEIEKQANVVKEKREPTVSDLFKIIKLQNEQLQLLQEKVDKFISNSQQGQSVPVQNCISEQVSIETMGKEQHKISIGVMTSFEMVRTSTIINKEVLKTNENSQIQRNRSQISIKEVVSKGQSPNLNFLDGITPVSKHVPNEQSAGNNQVLNEEKTYNDLSLYNIQVDNATTPLMSPEQSLYLDVRDYSDSEVESDDQSNVGWTYYNKVMTHVNGMLQDSEMPSSASALYRNTRQQMQTVQMQIDKTNVSVTKRVKFGDDPLGIHQPHIYAGSSDTSIKMNQLAAKYLKGAPQAVPLPRQTHIAPSVPIDMSFATKNYMDRHKLLQGAPSSSKPLVEAEMPRFLDITALKQQPKFL